MNRTSIDRIETSGHHPNEVWDGSIGGAIMVIWSFDTATQLGAITKNEGLP